MIFAWFSQSVISFSSRLNGLLSAKWVMLIILLTIVEGTSQSFLQTYSQALQQWVFFTLNCILLLKSAKNRDCSRSANTIHPLARYALLASSYLFECYEAAKLVPHSSHHSFSRPQIHNNDQHWLSHSSVHSMCNIHQASDENAPTGTENHRLSSGLFSYSNNFNHSFRP